MKKTVGIISANFTNDRFGTLTENRTIASIPFAGRYRLIDFALSNMINSGINTVGIMMPYNYRSLIDHVEDGREWDFRKKDGGLFPLPGSVFGVKSANGKFLLRDFILNNRYLLRREEDDYVLICGSNIVMNMDFKPLIKYHTEHEEPITLVYKEVERAQSYCGPFLKLDEQGHVYAINHDEFGEGKQFLDIILIDKVFLLKILNWFENVDYMDLVEILMDNTKDLPSNAFEFEGYAGIINSIEDYLDISFDMLKKTDFDSVFMNGRTIFTKVQDEAPTLYRKGAKASNSIVAAGSIIEGEIDHCIVFRNVHVKPGAKLVDCIVLQHAVIDCNAKLSGVVIDKEVHITEGITLEGSHGKPMIIPKGKQV